MAQEESEFTSAMRGYNREEVDSAISDLRREVAESKAAATERANEAERLRARVDELSGELEEVGRPTYSGLGTRLESTLRLAEQQSTRLLVQADETADRILAWLVTDQ